MKKLLYILPVVAFNFNIMFGQNAEQDFAKVNANFLAATNVLIETDYKVFANHFSKAPLEISQGIMKQKGNKIYQSISTVQSLMNEKISVHVDTSDKILVVSDPVNMEEQRNEALKMDLKKMLGKCKHISSKEEDKNSITYYLEFKENVVSEYSRCDITIDKKRYLISKLIYYYNTAEALEEDAPEDKKETPRLEITFKKIDTSVKLKDDEFDERKFIRREGNKILASNAFKEYKVIDNRYYTRKLN